MDDFLEKGQVQDLSRQIDRLVAQLTDAQDILYSARQQHIGLASDLAQKVKDNVALARVEFERVETTLR